jgi:hypothetical protein
MRTSLRRVLEPSAVRWTLLAALAAGLGGGCLGGSSGPWTVDGGASGGSTTGSATVGAGGAGTTSSSSASASASSGTATAGSGSAGGGSATAPQFSTDQCYFTSYPEGSLHCVTAPCTVTDIAAAIPTCATDDGVYENFAVAGAIYGAYSQSLGSEAGLVVALYPNASSTFPACLAGGAMGEPSDPGDYYGTGLVVGQTSMEDVAHFCTGSIGTFP